jgi:hypothetical protein
MDYPEYAAFTKRFGEEPSTYFEKLSFAQLQCIARELEIAFIPPHEKDAPESDVRRAIIDVAVADFQEPWQEGDLVRAVEHCLNSGT